MFQWVIWHDVGSRVRPKPWTDSDRKLFFFFSSHFAFSSSIHPSHVVKIAQFNITIRLWLWTIWMNNGKADSWTVKTLKMLNAMKNHIMRSAETKRGHECRKTNIKRELSTERQPKSKCWWNWPSEKPLQTLSWVLFFGIKCQIFFPHYVETQKRNWNLSPSHSVHTNFGVINIIIHNTGSALWMG